MPQITVFTAQQKIIDCYIVSDELFNELTRVTSIFELKLIPISFLEELQKRFLTFISQNIDSSCIDSQVTHNFPWYLDLLDLLNCLHRLNTDDLTLELTHPSS